MLKNYGYILFLLFCTLLFACGGEEMSEDDASNDSIDQEVTSDDDPMSSEDDSSGGDTTVEEDPVFSKTLKVLFVGNSLTYTNDLPKLVKDEAVLAQINLQTDMQALPNYALIDHWDDGNVQDLIKENKYDFVIIQQGPSSQAYGREVLIEYGEKFKTLCDQNQTKLVYFMVWPSKVYYYTFDDVIKNHRDAASINKALLAPVGELWKKHFDETADFSYYGPDDFHPSLSGSKVAAKIIAETLF